MRGRGGVNRSAVSSSVSVSAGAASHETDVVVIGSGVGGLSAAAMLSRHGDSVTVLESHYLPGGVAHAFDIEGYRCISLFAESVACGRQAWLTHVVELYFRVFLRSSATQGFDHGDKAYQAPGIRDGRSWSIAGGFDVNVTAAASSSVGRPTVRGWLESF